MLGVALQISPNPYEEKQQTKHLEIPSNPYPELPKPESKCTNGTYTCFNNCVFACFHGEWALDEICKKSQICDKEFQLCIERE